MSYFRQIHTLIWKDEEFLEYTPEEKILFVYFFSNESTTLSGLYKIPLRVVSFETNIILPKVKTILKKFEDQEKIWYRDGFVFVKNFQKYNKGGDTVAKAIEKEIDNTVESEIKTVYLRYYPENIPYAYPTNTLLQEEKSKEEYSKVKKSIEEFLQLPIPESPLDADKHPLIALFKQGCDYTPASKEYKNVIDTFGVLKNRYQTFQELIDDIKRFSIAWTSRKTKAGKQYPISNLVWFYEWLLNNDIPVYSNGSIPGSNKKTIKIDGVTMEVGMP